MDYDWDDNGNLLNDGVNTYEYDAANRLVSFSNANTTATYRYNGLGDRLEETVNGNTTTFTMDLNMGLTQALSDGTNTYIYGNGRIAQVNVATEYFLGDALGSVRQLTDASGAITYTRAYDPYGVVSVTSGSSQSAYGFTNEYTSQGLIYLRSRMYSAESGRFLTKDSWLGDYDRPLSLNRWNYTSSNPINYTDPSGYCAGYKGLDAPISTVMSFTAPYLLNGEHWKATGNAWKDAWNTCVDSLQKAGIAFYRGDYIRAYAYASGITASFRQASERIGQINHEMDILWCEDASLGDKIVAGLDVGSWSIGISSLITPFAYEGWLAAKGAIGKAFLPKNLSTTIVPYDPEFAASQVNKGTAYYVRPNGDVIPANGYRYISNKASYLKQLIASKIIPANPSPLGGTYISFDLFDVPSPGILQVPPANNAAIRIEFDTLQIVDDLRIPYGNQGKAPWLEPITRDFPEFGPGSARQATTNLQIIVDTIVDLLVK